ncbi:MAG: low molecular weight phosphotyrosine protein phosphatase [Prevotellaceae bacterium]|nr:low molecular weight phosphotyrosine protein phosphatase [Prevotella sp.]MDD7258535.1 low molecular weight phosphotyrosine protein phosphatase [Prevotellaceae bacterium]MDY6131520.1 low molecular weight protein-tyrosine-phosphatase [Prevotella sp.]
MKTRLLFVCLGNICRSPAADAVMNHLVKTHDLESKFYIDSAGIGAWHAGQLPDRRMRQHGEARGYQFTHRARQVKREDFDRFDFIIGMDKENLKDLHRLAPSQKATRKILCLADFLRHHPGQATVPDPYYGGEKDFEFALDLIEDACEGLLDTLACPK